MPHCSIGADVIVGFPGETEAHFLETYEFLNALPVSYLHVFTYSERANTRAADMEEVVPMKTRNQRSRMLRILSEKKKRAFYEENLGKTFQVLFEDDVNDGYMQGFTENYIRVSAKYDPVLINEIKTVTLTEINERGTVEVWEPEQVTASH